MSKNIIKSFFKNANDFSLESFGNGHIHDTYLLTEKAANKKYILQKMNINVFKKPLIIADNYDKLYKHFLTLEHKTYQIAAVIKSLNAKALVFDNENNPWRLTEFIADSTALELVENNEQAYQGGLAYGWFSYMLNDLNHADFEESIPDFHNLRFRMSQFNEAESNDLADRKSEIKEQIEFFRTRESALRKIQDMLDDGQLPTRITHNDTKINNILFVDQKAKAVIDLDTVGPGSIFYDYGDSLRTMANAALEDEKDTSKVQFNISYFEAFTKGFLTHTKDILVENEKKYLHLAPILMTYIIGIRFLTDYLNGDQYYKTSYPVHNLVRTKVQIKLIQSIEAQQHILKEIISTYSK